MSKTVFAEIEGLNPKKCMKCGKCTAVCPAYEKMDYKPHEFVSLVDKGRAEELFESGAFFYCMSCWACAERCPRDVSPSRFVDASRAYFLRTNPSEAMSANALEVVTDGKIPQQGLMSAFRKYTY